ncbi:MAG: hypothetical protein SCK70_08620 [bacterium]|nr:hypothetical protein [bacterium]
MASVLQLGLGLRYNTKGKKTDATGKKISAFIIINFHRYPRPNSGLTGYYQLNKDERALNDYNRFIVEGIELDKKYWNELRCFNCLKIMWTDFVIVVKTMAIVWQAKGV